MLELDYESASEFVHKTRSAYWDGWSIVLWKPNRNGSTNVRGMFRSGRWGIATVIPVGDDGKWRVPKNAY